MNFFISIFHKRIMGPEGLGFFSDCKSLQLVLMAKMRLSMASPFSFTQVVLPTHSAI